MSAPHGDGGFAMSLKTILFSLGCVIAWFVLLPMLVIGGGIALFAYATFAELGAFLTGSQRRNPGYGGRTRNGAQDVRRIRRQGAGARGAITCRKLEAVTLNGAGAPRSAAS